MVAPLQMQGDPSVRANRPTHVGGQEHVCCETPAVQGDPSERVGRRCGWMSSSRQHPKISVYMLFVLIS